MRLKRYLNELFNSNVAIGKIKKGKWGYTCKFVVTDNEREYVFEADLSWHDYSKDDKFGYENVYSEKVDIMWEYSFAYTDEDGGYEDIMNFDDNISYKVFSGALSTLKKLLDNINNEIKFLKIGAEEKSRRKLYDRLMKYLTKYNLTQVNVGTEHNIKYYYFKVD